MYEKLLLISTADKRHRKLAPMTYLAKGRNTAMTEWSIRMPFSLMNILEIVKIDKMNAMRKEDEIKSQSQAITAEEV